MKFCNLPPNPMWKMSAQNPPIPNPDTFTPIATHWERGREGGTEGRREGGRERRDGERVAGESGKEMDVKR